MKLGKHTGLVATKVWRNSFCRFPSDWRSVDMHAQLVCIAVIAFCVSGFISETRFGFLNSRRFVSFFLEKCALELLFWMPPISWSICRVHNQDKHPNQIIFRKHRFYHVFVRWQQQIYIAKLCHSQAFLHWWISVCWNGSSTLQKVAQLWCHYIRITLIQCSNSVKFSQQFVCVRPLSVDDQFTIILTSVQFCRILSNQIQ